ncbi:MAG: hypothetical protein FVQ82_03680 [Planctomycetes bacterium]|nr:hypothetical protein [Planctomycetota bacterium]
MTGLSRREKIILILAAFAIALLISDKYILSPLMAKRSEVKDHKDKLAADVEKGLSVMKRRKLLSERWRKMTDSGLSNDPAVTEGIVLRYLEDVSYKNYLTLASMQPERIERDTDGSVREIEFLVSGKGNMKSVTMFLWDIENAPIPLKIKTMQMGASDESGSQMTIQMRVSSIYVYDQKNEMVNNE